MEISSFRPSVQAYPCLHILIASRTTKLQAWSALSAAALLLTSVLWPALAEPRLQGRAPALTVTISDGRDFDLDGLRGKVVLIAFWAFESRFRRTNPSRDAKMKFIPNGGGILVLLLLAASFNGTIAGDWAIAGDGCKAWYPHPTSGETIRWTGGCKDGFVESMGALEWQRRGKTYERDEAMARWPSNKGYASVARRSV
jgi:hypothetical protein